MASTRLRLAEKWFQRGLWLVAVLFSLFLAGLGSLIIRDLPKFAPTPSYEAHLDSGAYNALSRAQSDLEQERIENERELDRLHISYNNSSAEVGQAEIALNAVRSTRVAIGDVQEDQSVREATDNVNRAIAKEKELGSKISELQGRSLELSARLQDNKSRLLSSEQGAWADYTQTRDWNQLKIFLLRFALTCPLLILAVYLFRKHRKNAYWPFVWGYIFFSLYAFFLELLPYLPSYGGYSYYLVGIVFTAVVGKYGIQALTKYLERKKEEEANLPNLVAEKTFDPIEAYAKVLDKICPQCDRSQDKSVIDSDKNNFCPFCGTEQYLDCAHCGTRVNAYSRYCPSCGEKPNLAPAS